jgi:hypothetical protein
MKKITVKELQRVLKQTLAEEKAVETLREEVSQNLGPSVVVDVKLEKLAENVNDRIDVLERTGRGKVSGFKPALLLRFSEHKNPEVRRLAVRLLPERFATKFVNDKDSAVRHAAARKVPLSLVKEMLKRNPSDDELHLIYRSKSLTESPEMSPGEKLLGKVKAPAAPELSDFAYHNLAKTAIRDYNSNIEGQWDEPWAARYCASIKAASGVVHDPVKLWKEIQKILNEKDDRTLERYSLKEVAQNLWENFDLDDDSLVEEVDPIFDLLESNLSSHEYVNKANQVFKIRESIMPAGLRKYRMSEGRTSDIMIPCTGRLPTGVTMNRKVERSLDRYVDSWNGVQARRGEPIRINWSSNPMSAGSFSFNVELK